MSPPADDPIEQMWQHIDELQRLADRFRETHGETVAQPLTALRTRMGDTLSDIEQGDGE